MRKAVKIIGLFLVLLVLFRGIIFRAAETYQEVGTHPSIAITNKHLIERIEEESAGKELKVEGVLKIASKITRTELAFTSTIASKDPNELISTQEANCVGYAAMFNSVVHHLVREHALEDQLEAHHIIGQLKLFGVDLHQFFESPFFKDHDYNVVVDLQTGERIAIDPSVGDYLWIERVREK
jgi:hypothetical protein